MNKLSFNSKNKSADDPYKRRKRYEEALKQKKILIRQEFTNYENNKIAKNEILIPMNEIKLKHELNVASQIKSQKNAKYCHLKKILENLTDNDPEENKPIFSSPEKKLYNTYLLENSSIKKINNIDELSKKKNILKNELKNLEDNFITELQNSTILKNKVDEISKIIFSYKKKNENIMYLKRISDKKLSNIDNVGFKALETYKSSENNLNQIKSELFQIKDLEKEYIKKRVAKAKENKLNLNYEEDNISKLLLTIEEKQKINEQLIKEIQSFDLAEKQNIEKCETNKYIIHFLTILESIAIVNEDLSPEKILEILLQNQKNYKNQLNADADIKLFFKKFQIKELVTKLLSNYKKIIIQNESLKTIHDDLNHQIIEKKSIFKHINLILSEIKKENPNNEDIIEPFDENYQTYNISLSLLNDQTIDNLTQKTEKYQKSIFYIHFSIMAILKRLCEFSILINKMTGITNLLTNFVNNLINIKLIGLINVFSFKDVKPALQKLISNDSSRNSEIMRSSSINEKIIKKSESEIARFDGWDLGIKRSNEIKELFCDIFKNENEEIKIILQEFFKTIKEDPFLDFFGIDLLKDYFKMIKKEIRNTNKFQNLKMIRKDIFRNFVINLENDKIKLMFESTYDLILNIRDQSENITSNIRKRSPPSPNSPTKQKYPLSDYIKTSFKKISQRIYNFSMNDNDDLQDYNEVTNTMDRFYNLEKNQLEKEKELNKINNNPKHAEDNEENIFEYIEKVNSFIKENDPKIKYSKLNLKKNVFNKNKDTKKDFDERGYDKLTDEEFHEMERSKLKNSVFEENSPFSKNKKYKKSLSMYENISNHSLYPQRSKEAKEIKKYTKEAELISKIYRMDKKISTKNLFEFTNDLIIEKKLKSLHFKQETNDFRSFNYLKKNDLYERRRIESQTIRNRIKKNAITLPISWDTKNKQDFLRKTTNTLKFKNTSEKNFIVRSKTTNNKFRTNKKMHSMELDYDILFERKPEYIFPELELPEFLMLKNNNSNYFESKSILIQPVIT